MRPYLRRSLAGAPAQLDQPMQAAMAALETHFRLLARAPSATPKHTPLLEIDRAIQAALNVGPTAHARAIDVLVSLRGIRMALLQHPEFYGLRARDVAAATHNLSPQPC